MGKSAGDSITECSRFVSAIRANIAPPTPRARKRDIMDVKSKRSAL